MTLINTVGGLISELNNISKKPIIVSDKDENIIYINDVFEKQFNYSLLKIKNHYIRDIFIWFDKDNKAVLIQKSGEIYDIDFQKITSVEKVDIYILNLLKVINYRELFTENIACSNFFENISDPIVILDGQKKILYLNNFANVIFKTKLEEIKDKFCYDLHYNGEECNYCPVTLSINSGEVANEKIYSLNTKKWFNISSYPIFTDKGEIIKVIEHYKDISEEKQIEHKIEWEQVLQNIEHPTFILSPNNIILEVNKATLNLFKGKTKADIIGKKCCEIFHGTKNKPKFCPSHEMKTTKKPFTALVESEIVNKNFIVSCTPIFDRNNNLIKIIHVATNISHLKTIETNLYESKEKLRLLLDNIPGVAYRCLYDKDWTMLFLSREFKTLTGYNIKDFIKNKNKTYNEIIHPDDIENVWNTITKSITKDKNFILEYKIITKTGTIKHVWEKGRLIKRNKFEFIEGVIFDITDRKNIEINLKASEEKYRILVENQNEIIIKLDLNGRFTYLSNTFYKAFRQDDNNIFLGENFIEFLFPEDREAVTKSFISLKTSTHSSYYEHKIMTNNGLRWFAWSNKAILNPKGRLVEIVGVGRDITERKIIESELIKAKEKIEESDKLKSIFLANLSKEVKTYVNTLIESSKILALNEKNNQEVQNHVNFINNSANNLMTIINGLLDISQIDNKQIKVEKRWFNLAEIIDELNQYFRPKAEEKNLEFVVLKHSENNIKVHTDKTKLKQILTILLDNAIKFTNFGSVKLGYKSENENIRIYVADTGIGIESSNHKLIFERFKQIKNNDDNKLEGNGLGLSIAKAYAKAVCAEIEVNSNIKNGSIFSLKLPIISSTTEDLDNNSKNSKLIIDFSKLNILIVEDEEINFLLLKAILSKLGSNLLRATTGLEAIEIFRNNIVKIDLVLMDIKLQGLNGIETLLEIKNLNTKVPIIACTAYAQKKEAENLLNQGFDDYIPKPINRQHLINIIQQNITRKNNN